MKLVATVLEKTVSRAVEVIRSLDPAHDMVEVRAEQFPEIDFAALRNATARPIILTVRGGETPLRALDEGIDFIDVEWPHPVAVPGRTVHSHHDYEGVADVEEIMTRMRATGCAYTKLAASPRTFAENERLLALLPGTVIGMGERGLYTRVLAPFLGSELAFVAASQIAAPAQLTLERALEIYSREPQRAERVFAVVGNPAGHSLSPVIHNALFREKGVPGAYTIASFESLEEIVSAFLRGNPCGLSVTTPFKEDALRVAGAEIAGNARRANAVNTLVNVNGRIFADNTDVDGFAALLGESGPHRLAAVLGAGPTARAASVALEDMGIAGVVFDRSNMQRLPAFDGDLIINTLPPGADVEIPPCGTYVEAAYSGTPRDVRAGQRIGGIELLRAQAVRQHQLFMRVFDGV
jgi:3-dehydroquinate dehydratase type I